VARPYLIRSASRWLRSRFERRSHSDGLSQSAQDWEAQYSAGGWDFLTQLSELPRYSVLAGYVCHLSRGGAVLDVGCGQGILLRSLPDAAYSKYVGIDLSASAIAAAQEQRRELQRPEPPALQQQEPQQNQRSTFLSADCESYVPGEKFDVIVFNEVLYYLRDPQQLVERYAQSLRGGGVMLVSMCTAARGSAAILGQLKAHYATVAETLVRDGETRVSWACAVFRPLV
jgi:2-polyprenyl-3-methyl-5-hydroxy-6-metoxy-1,4-benzoquinol methylase